MKKFFIILGIVFIFGISFLIRKHFMINENVLKEQDYELKIDIPDTNYEKLNSIINNKIKEYILEFKSNITTEVLEFNSYYSLIIYYKEYNYNNYLSYAFFVEYFTGGAHPNHDIWTVVFNRDTNDIIGLDYLISKNRNILNIFSTISRNELMYDKGIVDTSMMMEGTRPMKENFSRYVFSNDGIILFFPQYQVAPYSSGQFTVTLPYKSINF